MSRPFRWITVGAAVCVLASGCALQDTRYDYSRNGLPFADYDESILDWNFPTSTNQGPLTAPERLRPWRPAVGVPWANGNPMPWNSQTPISDSATEPSAGSHDAAEACNDGCAPLDAPHVAQAGAGVADSDPRRDDGLRVTH